MSLFCFDSLGSSRCGYLSADTSIEYKLTQLFNEESEGLLKEVFYVNRKIFEEVAENIWEEAKERIGGEATNV